MPLFNIMPAPWLLESGESGQSSAGALVANTTYLVAVIVPAAITIVSMRYRCTTASGNCDLGIYDPVTTNLLGHTGAVAVASGVQNVNLTANLVIGPGRYYLAFWIDNATATIFRVASTNENLTNALNSTSTNATSLAANIAGMGGVTSPSGTKVVMSAVISGGMA